MIKARGRHASGIPMIILGLTEKNLELLKAGKPISFHGGELGLDCQVLIMYGADEQAIAKELGIVGVKVPEPGETQRLDPLTGKLRTDKHS